MKKVPPTVENVFALLPDIQEVVRTEIAARIAAGEDIASADSPGIREMLARRREALMKAASEKFEHKSAA
ncbi:MAG: hypothetical protein ABIT04_07635 [Novosphingobium sp.]